MSRLTQDVADDRGGRGEYKGYGLTEADRKRMLQFAKTPMYARDPTQLLPGETDEPEDEAET